MAEETQALREELAGLEARREQGAMGLARHCEDMARKISSVQQDQALGRDSLRELQRCADDLMVMQRQKRAEQEGAVREVARELHEELEALEEQLLQKQIQMDDADRKLRDLDVMLGRCVEHQAELRARLERGGKQSPKLLILAVQCRNSSLLY